MRTPGFDQTLRCGKVAVIPDLVITALQRLATKIMTNQGCFIVAEIIIFAISELHRGANRLAHSIAMQSKIATDLSSKKGVALQVEAQKLENYFGPSSVDRRTSQPNRTHHDNPLPQTKGMRLHC